MRRPLHTFAVALGVCAVALLAGSDVGSAAGAGSHGRSRLLIETPAGRHVFTVEVATTPASRRRGLMHRRSMAPDAGMLFDYGRAAHAAMWMKNTFIPLDMLFIGGDGLILKIAERTMPHSLETMTSDGPVRAVLEVNAGTVARLGIRTGDLVRHVLFANMK